jgi:hypothetical protein
VGPAMLSLERPGRIDFVDFLHQPGPAGATMSVQWRFVDDDGCRGVMLLFGQPSGAARAVGVVAVIPYQMLVLVRDVVQEQPQPLQSRHELIDSSPTSSRA